MTKLPAPKEADIRRLVTDCLRLNGWFVYYNLQGLGCYPGLPDLVATKAGRTIHIELKRPGGKQRPHQREFQRRLEEAGGTYLLVAGLEDIEHLGRGKSVRTIDFDN